VSTFRDYQLHEAPDLFTGGRDRPFPGRSGRRGRLLVHANLLPFTLLAMRAFRRATRRHAGARRRRPKSVGTAHPGALPLGRHHRARRGRGERSAAAQALGQGGALRRCRASVSATPAHLPHRAPPAHRGPHAIAAPAYHHIDLPRYTGFRASSPRAAAPTVHLLLGGAGVGPPLVPPLPRGDRRGDAVSAREGRRRSRPVQDEYFLTGRTRVQRFCQALERSGLHLMWKAFGRIKPHRTSPPCGPWNATVASRSASASSPLRRASSRALRKRLQRGGCGPGGATACQISDAPTSF